MSEVIQNTRQDFWRSPTVLEPMLDREPQTTPGPSLPEACAECSSEFMIGARFCHNCGLRRPAAAEPATGLSSFSGFWVRNGSWIRERASVIVASGREISLPGWLHYLHFHEIQRWVGLSTASLIAFLVGLGCVAGAISVSVVYKASNLADFQAIQMWRIEWLLAATASFVVGILLKKPSTHKGE